MNYNNKSSNKLRASRFGSAVPFSIVPFSRKYPGFRHKEDPEAFTDPRVAEMLLEQDPRCLLEEGFTDLSWCRYDNEYHLELVRDGSRPAFLTQCQTGNAEGLLTIMLFDNLESYRALSWWAKAGVPIVPDYSLIHSRHDLRVGDFWSYADLVAFVRMADASLPVAALNTYMVMPPARAVYHLMKGDLAGGDTPLRELMLGKLYGYPECCILYFCGLRQGTISKHPLHERASVLHVNHQPIPCHECAARLLSMPDASELENH